MCCRDVKDAIEDVLQAARGLTRRPKRRRCQTPPAKPSTPSHEQLEPENGEDEGYPECGAHRIVEQPYQHQH